MPPIQRRAVIAGLTVATLLFVSGFSFIVYFWHLSRQFPEAPFQQPSRLYATPTRLAPRERLALTDLVAELEAAGYRAVTTPEGRSLPMGSYRRDEGSVSVHLRRFATPEGEAGGQTAVIEVQSGRVRSLRLDDRPAREVTLEPPLLASFYGSDLEERRPVTLAELPDYVPQAILAAEDDRFYSHPGISPVGIARALWVNLRGGEVQQGGSTITQQLVKNLYLSSRRSLPRKAEEASIALILEARYGKKSILEAYLNEIYWGKSGSVNVIGLGAASWCYFHKHPSQLTLAEAATLAGMIQAPGAYLPTEHPEPAAVRRNWVLKRLGKLGWIPPEQVRRAQAEPLVTDPETAEARPHAPYFVEVAEREARERFDIDELDNGGYRLFATLRWRDQQEAEKAMQMGVAALEKGWERGHKGKDPLQGALLSVDPRDGAILAYVGGRSYSLSQFDRVMNARRQAGSTFKPVVYAAAFEDSVASPASLLKDSPILVKARGMDWRPQNYDRGFRGLVTVRMALEQSINIPTVRLAMQVGLPRVVDEARGMGFTGDLDPVPSLALGALEATPYEMAQAYATLAGGGMRPDLHGLAAVRDRFGEAVLGDDLPAPRRVMAAEAAYTVTSILQGSLDRGTASGARGMGVRDRLAGKTGTTNDRRDNWFAGYSADRVTVVWVGYDDNSRTRLSGARAALPVWSRFTAAVRPAHGYPPFIPPKGIVTVSIDPATGQLATPDCPERIDEIFPELQAPTELCWRHRPNQYAAYETAPIDPATGEPYLPDAHENAAGRIEISNFGYGYGSEPVEPLTDEVDEADTTASEEPVEGTIVIRPSRPRPAPPVHLEPVATSPPTLPTPPPPRPPDGG